MSRVFGFGPQSEKYHSFIREFRSIGNHLIAMRQTSTKPLDVAIKADGSLLSSADRYAASSIRTLLNQEYPSIPVFTEEDDFLTQQTLNDLNEIGGWIVDPLDNTRDYIAGKDQFSLLLTYVKAGHANACLIYYPVSGQNYTAEYSYGCFSEGRQLSVSSSTQLANAEIIQVYSNELGIGDSLKITESTDAFVAVAKGTIDVAFIRMCGHKIWDLAFSVLLVTEAGGRVTDEHGQVPLFATLEPSYDWLIVSNGILHNDALAML